MTPFDESPLLYEPSNLGASFIHLFCASSSCPCYKLLLVFFPSLTFCFLLILFYISIFIPHTHSDHLSSEAIIAKVQEFGVPYSPHPDSAGGAFRRSLSTLVRTVRLHNERAWSAHGPDLVICFSSSLGLGQDIFSVAGDLDA
jgi:hypothetical protein